MISIDNYLGLHELTDNLHYLGPLPVIGNIAGERVWQRRKLWGNFGAALISDENKAPFNDKASKRLTLAITVLRVVICLSV